MIHKEFTDWHHLVFQTKAIIKPDVFLQTMTYLFIDFFLRSISLKYLKNNLPKQSTHNFFEELYFLVTQQLFAR